MSDEERKSQDGNAPQPLGSTGGHKDTPTDDRLGVTRQTSADAAVKKARRISFVWIIPILALIVTGLLLWNNTLNKGPLIYLSMDSAEGMEAGKTRVKYRSVNVGMVEAVNLSPDYDKTVVSIRMNPENADLLNRDTIFWVVKARVESSSISGLDTILSGAYINLFRGKDPEMGTEFTLAAEQPMDRDSKHGTEFTLVGKGLNRRMFAGDPVKYRGFAVGSVLSARLDPKTSDVTYRIQVYDPYDELVQKSTVFWLYTGIDVSLSFSGMNINSDTFSGIMQGGAAFDNFGTQSETAAFGNEFTLYRNDTLARAATLKDYPHYVVMVNDTVGNLRAGSSVFIKGIKVGEVEQIPWFESTEEVFGTDNSIPVLIAITTKTDKAGGVEEVFKKALEQQTVCATVSGSNMLMAHNMISLDLNSEDKCPVKLTAYRGVDVIPLGQTGSIAETISDLTQKISEIDFAKLSDKLSGSLDSLDALLASLRKVSDSVSDEGTVARISQSLDGLAKTLDSIRKTSDSFNNTQTLYDSINGTMIELKNILRDLAPAARQLGQKPNSIIFGSDSEDPVPKVSK